MSYQKTDINFNNICRICLEETKCTTGLFSEQKESKEILDRLHLCFQIILTYKEYLPCLICKNCIEELNVANNFRLKCVTSEERFLTYFKHLSENDFLCNTTSKEGIDPLDQYSTSEFLAQLAENKVFNKIAVPIGSINDNGEVDVRSDEESDTDFKDFNCTFATSLGKETYNHNKLTDTHTCNECSRSFKKKSSLLRHISMHENRKHVGKITGFGASRRYHCPNCTYSTPYSQTLINHVRRHTGEKPYLCECGKRFTDLSTFNAHSKIHSNITYYTCSICGKQFKFSKALRQHLRSHESGKFSCEICQKILKSRQTLQDHTRRHYNIRNFNCEDCGNRFVSSSELIHHKEKHKTEKNLECNLCGYKTLRRRNLIIHLKRHANDRQHKCDSCDATFYTQPDVRRHQRVHTKEKDFRCLKCPKSFTRKSALDKHIQSVHGLLKKWQDIRTIQVSLAIERVE